MSKGLIIGIVAGVLVIGGGSVYFITKDSGSTNNAENTASQTQDNNQQQEESLTSNGSIFSLTESGKSQKCTFNYSGENGTGNGTMYSDGSGRGLMEINVQTEQGNSGESNMLVLDDKVYGWTVTNGKSIGFVYDKATFSQNSGSQQSTTSNPNQSFDLDCENWTIDEAVLTVPTDVTFSSLPGTN